ATFVQRPQPQPTPVINSPVQPFVNPPVQPFVMNAMPGASFGFGVAPPMHPPIITTTWSPIFSMPQGYVVLPNSASSVMGNGVTVVVPNGTVITNSTVVVQQPQQQMQTHYFGPGVPHPTPAPTQQLPRPGTTREDVLKQLGTPSATIITKDG